MILPDLQCGIFQILVLLLGAEGPSTRKESTPGLPIFSVSLILGRIFTRRQSKLIQSHVS